MNQIDLSPLFARSGAAAWGDCAFSHIPMAPAARDAACALCPNPQQVFLAAYPYYAGDAPGNLSLYARGADYHQVLLRRLGTVCTALEGTFPGYHFVPGADNSPLPEGEIAHLAGVGLRGRNGLTIVPPYGSWVFLGTILTDLPREHDRPPIPSGECLQCGACVRACPGGALRTTPFDPEQCLSHLTQKKGALTGEQEALLSRHPLIWGCDRCQSVCPYNQNAPRSPLGEFNGADPDFPLIHSLKAADLDGLSNRTFRAKYGSRSFSWRGPAVLRRNLERKADSASQ